MTEADKGGVVRGPNAGSRDGTPESEDGSTSHPGAVPSGRASLKRGLSDQTQLRLGNHLRTMYDSVLRQPVPDRFRDLIERLDSGKPGGR